jgi:prevent-host-death family protein
MATIPQKELRNNVAEVLRRAEAGEEFTITVAGRPAAQLGPTQRGGHRRRRAVDLAIAATANVAGVPLLTHDDADFQIIDDLVAVRAP